jgi:hypothetical protein
MTRGFLFIILINPLFTFTVGTQAQDSTQQNIKLQNQFVGDSLLVSGDSVIKPDKLSIVFAGDIMGHDAQILGAWQDSLNSYNYEPTFRYIADYISNADIAIGNMEVTLAGKPFKGYPQFSSPDALAAAAMNAGFDIMVLANNHALDRGAKGMVRTHWALDSLDLLHTGTFLHDSLRAKNYPLIIEKNNIRLALLNYTYGTNGLTIHQPYSINRLDTAVIHSDLNKAKLAKPDLILVVTHWGIEYQREENKAQQQMAAFIFNHGADVIIGSHPHVIQPVKYYYPSKTDSSLKYPVFYSMGNFVSNQRAEFKDGGIMAELHLSKTDSVVHIDSLAWMPYWVYRKDSLKKSTFYVLPVGKYESDTSIVRFNSSDRWRFKRFVNDTREHLKDCPVPESSFYLKPQSQGIVAP